MIDIEMAGVVAVLLCSICGVAVMNDKKKKEDEEKEGESKEKKVKWKAK